MKIIDLIGKLAHRSRKEPITTIVLHATAGASASSSFAWLKKIGLSYHGIIADEDDEEGDGAILKAVADTKVAFHAGKSFGPGGDNVNRYSLGLSFSCFDTGNDPISRKQWDSAVERCAQWCRAYPSIQFITTHALISPGRKVDPRGPVALIPQEGGKFPIREFCRQVTDKAKRQILPWPR